MFENDRGRVYSLTASSDTNQVKSHNRMGCSCFPRRSCYGRRGSGKHSLIIASCFKRVTAALSPAMWRTRRLKSSPNSARPSMTRTHQLSRPPINLRQPPRGRSIVSLGTLHFQEGVRLFRIGDAPRLGIVRDERQGAVMSNEVAVVTLEKCESYLAQRPSLSEQRE